MNTHLYKCSHNFMIPMHRKFNDDIFARFQLSWKMLLFHLQRKIDGRLWGHPVTSWMTSSSWKILFGLICNDLFISEVKLKLCLIFQNFQNGRHFELATSFFTGNPGSWIYQKDFQHFELLINALAQILTEIYQFQNLTYFVSLWRHQWRHECVKHNLHN